MEAKAGDGGRRDVIVGDTVEAEVCSVTAGWSTEMAAFELALASFEGQPGLLLGGLKRYF
jgi:hypothetical protein